MYRLTYALTIIIVAFIFLAGPIYAQEEDSGLTLEARAGFDGAYRGGEWTPVTVRAANNGPDIEGELRVVIPRGGVDETVYSAPISLPTRSDKRITLYVDISTAPSRLIVELRDARGRLVAEVESNRLDRLTEEEPLYGIVSSEPAVWTFIEQVSPRGVNAAAALLALEELPEAGPAWQALDVLVLNNVDSSRLNAQQLDALRGWVELGGHLVLTGGSGWQETTAPFAGIMPVSVQGVRSVDDLPALAARMGVPFRDPGPYLVAESALQNGEVLLREGELPLLARRDVGRGAVYFLALDPALAPLLDWRGSELLWAEVGLTPSDPPWANGPQNPYSAAGALSGLPSLALPSVLALLFFLGVYIVVVGPINYAVLRRMGRRELAWLSIPALVLLFSALAYVGGFRLRGNDVILNQVSIVYGAMEGETARNMTLLGIFSPRRAAYDVQLPADALVHPFSRSFGEMSGAGSEAAISRGANVLIEAVRVDVSGMETYVVERAGALPAIQGSARLHIEGGPSSGVRIEVDLQNNSGFALENAGVLAGNGYIELGDLQPGERVTQDQTLTGGLSATMTGSTGFSTGMPISPYYEKILGTSDFYGDRQVQARFQLLESMQNYSGPISVPAGTAALSRDVLTLIAWSQQPQLDISIPELGDGVAHQVTTLYFLELPIDHIIASGQDVRVPPALLEWQLEDTSGAFINSITDFYLPPGRVDITYTPWPAFQQMDVTSLQINLTSADRLSAVPDLYLWNHEQEAWNQIPAPAWGNISVSDFTPYLGPQNRIALRLDNSAQGGVSVERVFPVLVGDVE